MTNYGGGAAKAFQAYRHAAEAAMSPADAAVTLHERLCQELFAAKIAYERGALDRMCLHTARCTQVILELRGGLKPESGEGARALDRLYLHLFLGVARVLRVDDPARKLQDMTDTLWKLSQRMRVQQATLERNDKKIA